MLSSLLIYYRSHINILYKEYIKTRLLSLHTLSLTAKNPNDLHRNLYYGSVKVERYKHTHTHTRRYSTRKLYGCDVTAQFEGDIIGIKYNSSDSNVKTTSQNSLIDKSELFVRISTKLRNGWPGEWCSICSNLQTGSVAHAVSFPMGTMSSFLGHKYAGTYSHSLI
jgi:hypothetical protein